MKLMKETIVFHSPLLVERKAKSGSVVRPLKMLNAFRELGLEVLVVDGDSESRKRKWEQVRKNIKNIIGVYSELSTMPIALSDPDHFPRHPFQDMAWFQQLRKMDVPVAVFYRDIHWRFPQYKNMTTFPKRLIAQVFYHLELHQLVRSVSHIFLPSLRMASFIPASFSEEVISALPPGACVQDHPSMRKDDVLRLLYVGGVAPPLYDLAPMIRVVRETSRVQLTICCRKEEWQRFRDYYAGDKGLSIVHYYGGRVNELFSRADVFLMFWRMSPYLSFSMPVKLFEAIGNGLPVVCNAGCEMGNFVEEKGVGWAVKSEADLAALLRRFNEDPSVISSCTAIVREQRHFHTWQARAMEVIGTLERCRRGGEYDAGSAASRW